jgi:MFS family permease
LTQLGYALGILLLAPLGDRHDRRDYSDQTVLVGIGTACNGFFPFVGCTLVASLAIRLTAAMAQDIVPAAAALAHMKVGAEKLSVP